MKAELSSACPGEVHSFAVYLTGQANFTGRPAVFHFKIEKNRNGVTVFHMEEPYSQADYEAVKAIAKRNGGIISQREIFSVTVRGYIKLVRIVDQLKFDGHIYEDGYYIDEEDRPNF